MEKIGWLRAYGAIWWPIGEIVGVTRDVLRFDLENMVDDGEELTRDAVELWVNLNFGDFSGIVDFEGWIGDVHFDLQDPDADYLA